MVGKGHGGHGQPQSGLPLQGFVHSEGAADEKDDVAGALGGAVRQIAGQLLAGALPPFHTHGDHQTAVGQLGPDSVGLLGDCLLYTSGILSWRKAAGGRHFKGLLQQLFAMRGFQVLRQVGQNVVVDAENVLLNEL